MKKAQKGKVLVILFPDIELGGEGSFAVALTFNLHLVCLISVSDPFKTSESAVTCIVVSLSKFIYDFFLKSLLSLLFIAPTTI